MGTITGEEMLTLIKRRQSDRGYLDRDVEQDKLDRILEAGRMAPSACNSQPWKFIVVDDPDIRKEVAAAATARELGFNKFIDQAPVLIVIVRGKPKVNKQIGGSIKNKDYSVIDTGIAAENICLQATAEGLGTCILGWFDEKRVKKVLQVPDNKRAELLITIGYPSKGYSQKKRKDPSELISYNKY
ncbi:MAG: nitroreductase family protein [Bacteroidales bacterium]|nr:nitroreductase family protein [Bacteroidales bacterium]